MSLAIVVHQRAGFSQKRLRTALEGLLAALGRADHALCVLLTGDDEVRALNRAYRKKDEPTDVLSFTTAPLPRGAPVLGDLAISLDTAGRQAKERGHDRFTEVVILCAHGLLHLCGYDHEESPAAASRMLRRERRLLRGIGIERDALTARGNAPAQAQAPRRKRR